MLILVLKVGRVLKGVRIVVKKFDTQKVCRGIIPLDFNSLGGIVHNLVVILWIK
jgi:hypothetical protein